METRTPVQKHINSESVRDFDTQCLTILVAPHIVRQPTAQANLLQAQLTGNTKEKAPTEKGRHHTPFFGICFIVLIGSKCRDAGSHSSTAYCCCAECDNIGHQLTCATTSGVELFVVRYDCKETTSLSCDSTTGPEPLVSQACMLAMLGRCGVLTSI